VETWAAFSRDLSYLGGANRSTVMPYIVKWIPKDLDMPIDHSTHYEQPEEAMEFACNILALEPKRIWIEDHEGLMYTYLLQGSPKVRLSCGHRV